MDTRFCRTMASFVAAVFVATTLAVSLLVGGPALADEPKAETDHPLEEHETYYVRGFPAEPSEAWVIAMGGRIYDNWMSALEADDPQATHPAWPASNSKTGKATWRCKSCHGWDLRGKDGAYGSGSYKTGIKGVRDVVGLDPNKIQAIIMDDTHTFTHEMIPEPYMKWVAAFLSKGQYDITPYVSDSGEVSGSPDRGKSIFQNICAACHGYNGTALDWGEDGEHAYVGTESNANPWEVFFKIRHGHPGVEMVSLAAFSHQDAADVPAYAKTLPQR